MSPPIYTPDGSEVSEIVLPDGSTASEVIGPDGNVVFEAGPDIPDSGGTHQWPIQQDETTTIEDTIGDLNLSLNRDFTASEPNAVDGRMLDPNGTDDVASNTSATSPTGDMTIVMTLDGGFDGDSVIIEYGDSSDGGNSVRTFRSLSSGQLIFSVFAGNGDAYGTSYSPSSGLIRVVGVLDTASSEIRIYENAVLQNSTSTGSSTFDTAASQLFIARRQDGGFHYGGRIDNPSEDGVAWTDTRIQDDYNAQPWS